MATRKRKRGKQRPGRKDNQTLLAVFFSVMVAAAVGWFVYLNFMVADRTEYDEITLCPVEGITGSLTILIDTSDPITAIQKKLIQSWLNRAVEDVEEGTLVRLASLAKDQDRFFGVCKPKNPQEANQVTDNRKLRKDAFESRFLVPLDSELNDMLTAPGADQSPIMESILPAVLSEEITVGGTQRNGLIIVSDLIQHSENFSFFRRNTWQSFKGAAAYQRLGKNLSGFDVQLYSIPRAKYNAIDLAAVQEFWWNYFDHQGVSSVNYKVVGDL